MLSNVEACVIFYLRTIGPMTGYDLTRHLTQYPVHCIEGGASTVYAAVNRLARQGYLVGDVIPQKRRPTKTVWSVSPRGRVAFLRWLARPLSVTEYRHHRPVFEVKCTGVMLLRKAGRRAFLEGQIRLLESYRRSFSEFARGTGLGVGRLAWETSLSQIDRDIDLLYALRGLALSDVERR
ncbi:MAG: PadR family transcriptional regulator [Bacillota bacterium]|nr:PadR family transcriptional regulator [Bacillota bacterium]